ncbi:hypothetical protein GEMRC1_006526 [Eukaryota sp. GEM-RC1]
MLSITLKGNFISLLSSGSLCVFLAIFIRSLFGFVLVDVLFFFAGLVLFSASGTSSLLFDYDSNQLIRIRRLFFCYQFVDQYPLDRFRGCSLEVFSRKSLLLRQSRSYKILLHFDSLPTKHLTFSADGWFLNEKKDFISCVDGILAGNFVTPKLPLFKGRKPKLEKKYSNRSELKALV